MICCAFTETGTNKMNPWLTTRIAISLVLLMCCSCAAPKQLLEYHVGLNQPAKNAVVPASEGDFAAAIALYKDAMELYKQSEEPAGELLCLSRMSWLERERGHYSDARALAERAIPLAKQLNGDTAEILVNLADSYMFAGDHARAEPLYLESIAVLKDWVFPTSYRSPPSKATLSELIRKCKAQIHCRATLSLMYYMDGRYDEALQRLSEADALIQDIEKVASHWLYGRFFTPPDMFWEGCGYTYTVRASCLGETDRVQKAYEEFDRGHAYFERAGSQYGILVNEALRLKIRFLSDETSARNEAAVLECRDFLDRTSIVGAEYLVWRVAYRAGSILAEENENEAALMFLKRSIESIEDTRSLLRDDTARQVFSGSVQDVYSLIIELNAKLGDFESSFNYLERSKARAFLDMLAGRKIAAHKSVDKGLVQDAAESQLALDKLRLSLLKAKPSDAKDTAVKYRTECKRRDLILERVKEQSLHYASTEAVSVKSLKDISSRLTDDEAILSFYVGDEQTLMWLLTKTGYKTAACSLGADALSALIETYREALAADQDELIQTAGADLSAAILDPFKKELGSLSHLYVVPSGSLYYLPFASLPFDDPKTALIDRMAVSTLPNATSLFYGAGGDTPQKGAFLMGNPQRGDGVDVLVYAEKEVVAISQQFKHAVVKTGKAATESLLRSQELSGVDVIHLAVHGRYNRTYPLSSALLLAKDQENDGNLESFEIFSMTIAPSLVVLSACESGLGPVGKGDEIQSLSRAFMYAGAETVIASHWKVPDASTAELMQELYRALPEHGPAGALAVAQRKMRKQKRAPRDWAGFYLMGSATK